MHVDVYNRLVASTADAVEGEEGPWLVRVARTRPAPALRDGSRGAQAG